MLGFDPNSSNRLTTSTAGPGSGGACTTSGATIVTNTFDLADRLTNVGTTYDALGRTLTTTGPSGTDTLTYHANDLVRSITTSGATSTYGLDPAGRFNTSTVGGVTTTNHYPGGGDSPTWTAGPATTRYLQGLNGMTGQVTGAVVTLNLTDLHGDIIATANPTGAAPAATHRYDEYGNPTGSGPTGRYGWLGQHQRQNDTTGLTLMGVRIYNPTIGRFLQVDPVLGGSCSPYEYACGDPINQQDIYGLSCGSIKLQSGKYCVMATTSSPTVYGSWPGRTWTANTYTESRYGSFTMTKDELHFWKDSKGKTFTRAKVVKYKGTRTQTKTCFSYFFSSGCRTQTHSTNTFKTSWYWTKPYWSPWFQ